MNQLKNKQAGSLLFIVTKQCQTLIIIGFTAIKCYYRLSLKGVSNAENLESGLLDSSGKFKDADLQSKYEDYCERKNNAGETPKDPLKWKEASEKWTALREQGQAFLDDSFNQFSQEYENAQREITIVINEGTKIRVDAIATDEE